LRVRPNQVRAMSILLRDPDAKTSCLPAVLVSKSTFISSCR
jgi:hypothetical protein